MEETNTMKTDERRQVQAAEPWMVQRAREILIATGRLTDFHVSDIPEDELREIVAKVEHSKRMRETGFSIARESSTRSAGGAGRSLIYDEVMKW